MSGSKIFQTQNGVKALVVRHYNVVDLWSNKGFGSFLVESSTRSAKSQIGSPIASQLENFLIIKSNYFEIFDQKNSLVNFLKFFGLLLMYRNYYFTKKVLRVKLGTIQKIAQRKSRSYDISILDVNFALRDQSLL